VLLTSEEHGGPPKEYSAIPFLALKTETFPFIEVGVYRAQVGFSPPPRSQQLVRFMADNEYEDILYEVRNHVCRITINRPEVLNAIRTATYDELGRGVLRAAEDGSVGVIVIRGAGERAFSSGGDVRSQKVQTQSGGRRHLQRALTLGQALRNCGKPVIAAVQGYCIGAGHELHLMCDLTISAESGRFGQTGANRGMVPIWGATQILPRVVGEKLARELIFTGRLLSAQEAFALGLVNQVVPDSHLDVAVQAMCDKLLDNSPQSLRIAKLSLNHAVDAMWPSFVDGSEIISLVYGSPEQREGSAAFLEKRKPDFNKFRVRDL
jgi:dihydroxynaphthoic acid synthetase